MKGYKTSFLSMFQAQTDSMPGVTRIEIPIIQRDYAQGREDAAVQVIRRDFLDVLVRAMAGGDSVDLDFVYGDIEDGTLRPLDGQQRLTTLFLIHWYVAARTGRLAEVSHSLSFAYATRPTAELFCRQLMKPEHQPDSGFTSPSEWIMDQAWYLFAWKHDPSVQSMLVMLDAIHERFSGASTDLEAAWARLTDFATPAISFHFLPINDMPSGEELYIKMNSRGKPLTEFENFKARFEGILAAVLTRGRFDEIVHKLDGAWTDLLWPYHGGDHIVDDEFLRYLEFIIEVCEWRDGDSGGGQLLERAERVFSSDNPNGSRNLDFLFHAFDAWTSTDIGAVFNAHFAGAATGERADQDQVVLFDSRNVNLFQACCNRYGQMNGKARLFSLSETLLLFAVLLHRQFATKDIQTRLRILRNLTDRSDEIRDNRMVDLIESVERLIRHNSLKDLRGFNPDRVLDEQFKREFLRTHPDQESILYELEDHPLLRGRVFAFNLDAETLTSHATAFASIAEREHWPTLTAALLAKGNYGFAIGERGYQYGSIRGEQERRWREVFTRYGRGKNGELPSALAGVLDAVAKGPDDAGSTLATIALDFRQEALESQMLDWRYYLITYPAMREGDTGIYYGEHLRGSGMWGYSMCMLRTNSITGGAIYRDPYLLAIWRESEVGEQAVSRLWFTGYEFEPRWLRLTASGAAIRCVDRGFELLPPIDDQAAATFGQVCERYGVTNDTFLPVTQADRDGHLVDTEDRVQKCGAFLSELVAAGL